MLNEQTFDQLYLMKLIGMAEGFKEQLEQPSLRDLSFEERFGMLVERQWAWKENKRLKRLLKDAKLKLQASLEDIDYRTPRGIEKSVILSLASCNWIRNHQNLLISGPTGVGKTFLACAFAQKACLRVRSRPSALGRSPPAAWLTPRFAPRASADGQAPPSAYYVPGPSGMSPWMRLARSGLSGSWNGSTAMATPTRSGRREFV